MFGITKSITIFVRQLRHKNMITLTVEYRKRTEAAKVETEKLLNKELSYPTDLQKLEKIVGYQNHIAKLNRYLANGYVG